MLNRDAPFNRNIYKSKLHFDNTFVASSVWNRLPEKVRCCDSQYTFLCKLTGYLFHSPLLCHLKVDLPKFLKDNIPLDPDG